MQQKEMCTSNWKIL